MVIESYVMLKVVLGLFLLFKIKYFRFESGLSIYFILETLFYLLSIIFLEGVHKKAVSFSRSLLLLFLNYLETVIYFAVIYKSYWYKNEIIENVSNSEIIKSLDALYFSFMTATTVGYGDIIPPNINIKMVCIAQTIIMLIFAMLFFNKFVSSLNIDK